MSDRVGKLFKTYEDYLSAYLPDSNITKRVTEAEISITGTDLAAGVVKKLLEKNTGREGKNSKDLRP